MVFSLRDGAMMRIALDEARAALKTGDYPVGAILLIDGVIVASAKNSLHTGNDWISHAETNLLRITSSQIKQAHAQGISVELFSTLEPCLMCLGSAILHRISRVVFACPDPHGGATQVDVSSLPEWYGRKWPRIESGLMREEAYALLVEFMEARPSWENILAQFRMMHESWEAVHTGS